MQGEGEKFASHCLRVREELKSSLPCVKGRVGFSILLEALNKDWIAEVSGD